MVLAVPLELGKGWASPLCSESSTRAGEPGGDEFTPSGSLAFGGGARGETHKQPQNKRQESPGKNAKCAQRAGSFHKCCLNLKRMEFSRQYPGENMEAGWFSSVAQLCPTLVTPRTAAHQPSLSIINSLSPPKLMSFESVIPSNHLILCHPLLLPPSILLSISVFSYELVLCISG